MWIGIDQNHMTNIIGNVLFQAAVFVMIAGGAFTLFISFLGFMGAITKNRFMIGLVSI